MVSVAASGVLRRHKTAAEFAGKAVVAGVCFIIPFFKRFTFVFSVHVSSGRYKHSPGGTACVDLPASRSVYTLRSIITVFQKVTPVHLWFKGLFVFSTAFAESYCLILHRDLFDLVAIRRKFFFAC